MVFTQGETLFRKTQSNKDELEWLMRRRSTVVSQIRKYALLLFLSACGGNIWVLFSLPEGLFTVRGVNKFFEMGPLSG